MSPGCAKRGPGNGRCQALRNRGDVDRDVTGDSMRWCRLYAEINDDPKIGTLSDEAFRFLINLWCLVTKESDSNDPEIGGKIPCLEHVCYSLRMQKRRAERLISVLIEAGLVDRVGDHLEPHNWRKRQHKSDDGYARVKRFRERKRNGNETFQETKTKRPQSQSTESDTDKSKSPSDSCAVTTVTRTDYSDAINQLWKVYPKRDGSNPKAPAAQKLTAILKSGVPLEAILSGARRYRAEMERKQQVGTAYVAQLKTWLHQQRWGDYNGATLPFERDERPPPP